MAISPSSSVQRARQELAERLHDIRLDAGLTARALSAAAGWHEAKTSRVESAKQAPSEADILQWCRVCGADREIPDLIAASRAADSMYVEWRRLNPAGLRRAQESRRCGCHGGPTQLPARSSRAAFPVPRRDPIHGATRAAVAAGVLYCLRRRTGTC